MHLVDLKHYVAFLNDIYSSIPPNVSIFHPLDPFLIHQAKQMQMHLDYFKPLNKRSLNSIGSTWKWIVGNPDLVILEQKINNGLQKNNEQVIINRMSLEKINEITIRSDEILRSAKISQDEKDSSITKLKYKLDILKDEIVNLQYAVHWQFCVRVVVAF